jgi:hypothetical protein
MTNNYFNLPNTPEEFGVILPPSELRRIDFSALEFDTLRNAAIEYMKTYYPDQFNDFVANNGIIMVMELVAYMCSIVSMRSDVLVEESFLPTALTQDAVSGHLNLINKKFKRPTPAAVNVSCLLQAPAGNEISIAAGLQFVFSGPDDNPVYYEIFRAPNDWFSPIIIPPGKRGVVAWGIEGRFETPITVVSGGGPNQTVGIPNTEVLDEPIIITIGATADSATEWRRVQTLEQSEPQDQVFEVLFVEEGAIVQFGDDIAGQAPLAGQIITVNYRSGGGYRGRITSGVINETRSISPISANLAPVQVTFQNLQPSEGGTDAETIEVAKIRGPREYATQSRAVSGEDYANLAKSYSHAVYGTVFKAVTAVKTSRNANIAELYLLALGADDTPVLPSTGLKDGVYQFFDEINPITDRVDVLDGAIKAVGVEMDVVISKSADAGTVKEKVQSAIDDFFDPNNWDMGEPLYVSQLYSAIHRIDGVSYTKIYSPEDDILQTKKIADPSAKGVGFNEMITLGSRKVSFFMEPGSSTVERP